VPWNGCLAGTVGIRVDRVIAAFAFEQATVGMEVFEEFGPFHADTGE
jgi:hypothetical protein